MPARHPAVVTSRRSAGVFVTFASRTMACHLPPRNIETSPRLAGVAVPSLIANRCRSAVMNVSGVIPARSFTTRLYGRISN